MNHKCPYCGRTLPEMTKSDVSSDVVYDYGPDPFVFNITEASKNNKTFRTSLWTGSTLQLTVMSILPGESIGNEAHDNLDQFIRITEGNGVIKVGFQKDRLNYEAAIDPDYAAIIPAGTWHNVFNTGTIPLKLYSIYAPPEHPFNTVHETKEDAMRAEKEH